MIFSYKHRFHKNRLFSHLYHIILAALLLQLGACNSQISRTAPISKDRDLAELKSYFLGEMENRVQKDSGLSTDVKNNIIQLGISPLQTQPEIRLSGSDSMVRPAGVGLQNAFEQALVGALEQGKVQQASVIIHTRKPATPLCNPPGKALEQTMSPRMQQDPKRSKTIEDRTITLRKLASNGSGVKLYIAYPERGFSQRSPEEQKIYLGLVNDPAYQSLHDTPLTCAEMPGGIVGASYILKSANGNTLFFGNNAVQAIDATAQTHWRYWLGSYSDKPVFQRYQEVLSYLNKCEFRLTDQL